MRPPSQFLSAYSDSDSNPAASNPNNSLGKRFNSVNEHLQSAISDLSPLGLIPIGLLFFCGLLLWVAGRRVMRVGFAATGLIAGGLLGATIGNAGDLGVAPWVVGASGALILAVVASLAYRLALAGAVGLLFATLAPLGVWTANEQDLIVFRTGETVEQEALALAEPPQVEPPQVEPDPAVDAEAVQQTIDTLRDALVDSVDQILASEKAATLSVSAGADDVDAEEPEVTAPLREAWRVARDGWYEAEAPLKGLLVAACAFGAMLGFVVGTGAPGFSAIVVSSLGGSFLILSTGWVMGARTFLANGLLDKLTPTTWTLLWLITSVLGLGIQWIFRPKRADKSAS